MDIKLTRNEKSYITHPDDVYSIMQRILLRENKLDREKEHFWMIGLNNAGYIHYIELVSLGSVRETVVEPMNVYRFAVMKSATRVIAIHNHPSGLLVPSDADKDITDRLIQVGKILDIRLEDHLIISPKQYLSFRAIGLMDELEQSLKYVPTYQVIEQIRKEEKAIAKIAVKVEKEKTKAAKEDVKLAREVIRVEKERVKAEKREKEAILVSAIKALAEQGLEPERIAQVLGVTIAVVKRGLRK